MTDAAPKARDRRSPLAPPALLAVAAVAYLVLREPPPPPADAARRASRRRASGQGDPRRARGRRLGRPFVVDGIEARRRGQEAAAILVHLSRPGVRMAISIARAARSSTRRPSRAPATTSTSATSSRGR
ncbi:MAG: hypothetical protein H6710_23990 [Myxococcales bacterium]|nr:hypothetical protein [Myxococcales bacterium]